MKKKSVKTIGFVDLDSKNRKVFKTKKAKNISKGKRESAEVKKVLEQNNINSSEIKGTGGKGKILLTDVQAYLTARAEEARAEELKKNGLARQRLNTIPDKLERLDFWVENKKHPKAYQRQKVNECVSSVLLTISNIAENLEGVEKHQKTIAKINGIFNLLKIRGEKFLKEKRHVEKKLHVQSNKAKNKQLFWQIAKNAEFTTALEQV